MVRRLCWLYVLGSLAAAPAMAGEPDVLVFGAGGTDIVRNYKTAPEVRLEYRPAWSLIPAVEPLFQVRPWAGIEVSSRGALWGGGGILVDVPVGNFMFTPSFGVGGYEQGTGRPLGSAIEFRSQFEAGYVFQDQSRVSAAFSHLSNAGLNKHNPGTEALVIQYALPIGRLFGY